MKTFYDDYVDHCMRLYTRFENPDSLGEIDKTNWLACDEALKTFNYPDREMLASLYRGKNTLSDNIYQTSRETHIKRDAIWEVVRELGRRIAQRRGLI
jgi:hypothetical protein